jgi:hypothetical protein
MEIFAFDYFNHTPSHAHTLTFFLKSGIEILLIALNGRLTTKLLVFSPLIYIPSIYCLSIVLILILAAPTNETNEFYNRQRDNKRRFYNLVIAS